MAKNHPHWDKYTSSKSDELSSTPGVEFSGIAISELEALDNCQLAAADDDNKTVKAHDQIINNQEILNENAAENSDSTRLSPDFAHILAEVESRQEELETNKEEFEEFNEKESPDGKSEVIIEEVPEKIVLEPETPEEVTLEPEIPEEIALEPEVPEEVILEPEIPEEIALEPEVPEDVILEPEIPEEIALEPEIPEEVILEPEISEEVTLEPEISEEVTLEPEISEEVTLEPEISEEVALEPEISEEVALEPEISEEVALQTILVEGLRLSKQKQYARAIRHLNQITTSDPEPELLYVAISELSSIYQRLGLYPMASDIIKAFITHPVLKDHPGMANLKQKMKFILCLQELLHRDHYGQIPYDQVPEAVLREAFDNSLTIKH